LLESQFEWSGDQIVGGSTDVTLGVNGLPGYWLSLAVGNAFTFFGGDFSSSPQGEGQAPNNPAPPTTFMGKLKAGLQKAGTCTKMEVVGGLGVVGGGGLFLFGTAEDLTVVGFVPGLITQASGGILATVGGATAAIGTIGKDLGVCE
jgi:hypothetical protein